MGHSAWRRGQRLRAEAGGRIAEDRGQRAEAGRRMGDGAERPSEITQGPKWNMICGQKFMLDRGLAELYGIKIKQLRYPII